MRAVSHLQDRLGAAVKRWPPPSHEEVDRLVLGLVDIARHYGEVCSVAALTSGLPLVGGRLPFEHAPLAARRAGLDAELRDGDPLGLTETDLPVLLVDSEGAVDILWSLERLPNGKAAVAVMSEPGRAEARGRIAVDDLKLRAPHRMVSLVPIRRESSTQDAARQDWLLPVFRQSKSIYAEAIAATVALNLLALAVPLFSMNVYDRVLPNAASDTLWALSIGLVFALMFEFAIKHLRGEFVDRASRRADVLLANFIYGRLLGARLSDKAGSTGVRANTLREFESLREFFNSATLTAFGDLPFLLLFIVVMAIVAGPLALIVLLMVPILLAIGWWTQKTLAHRMEVAFRDAAQKNSVIVETLVGLESLKAAGGESFAAGRYERAVADSVRIGHEIRQISNVGLHAIHTLQNLTQVILVVVGFYMVVAGQLTSGALIAATMLAGRAMQPLGQAAALLARLNQARMAYKSLSEIVHAPQERPEGASFLAKSKFDGSIGFENVVHRYEPDAAPSLADVSFVICPGERVALLGAIGSGKTTALKLMQALDRPTSGRVLIDGIAIGTIDPAVLRMNVALLPQGAELFSGTIRSNIALADIGSSDDALIKAAEAAGALEWIGRLPKGFDTPVRERGAGLSGGQKQLVALARALLNRPRIILLDEPTADMDGRTEATVINRLKSSLVGSTIVVVTHRPALLDMVDRIIVFDAGRKLLDGPKADVLDKMKAITDQRVAAAKAATAAVPRSQVRP